MAHFWLCSFARRHQQLDKAGPSAGKGGRWWHEAGSEDHLSVRTSEPQRRDMKTNMAVTSRQWSLLVVAGEGLGQGSGGTLEQH